MPPRKKAAVVAQTAACVPAIRMAVEEWREAGHEGVTDTTRTLLNHWFIREHRTPTGRKFAYYPAQREAIETLVYLYEIRGIRRHKDLLQEFASTPGLHILQFDDFARYAIKMATGSGKTKVMSLVIAWQYFNAVAEGRGDYAKTFLLLAPNVIVFDRLRSDFVNGNIFRLDPVVPPELRIFWDMAFYMRHDIEGVGTQGAVYLTNIQQLYQARQKEGTEPEPMTAVLGSAPSSAINEQQVLGDRLAVRGEPVMVINDEAHHVHDEDLEWNRIIRNLGENRTLLGQLDFSATPRYQKGGLFTWTVFDYPLKRAILDGVVKKPMKGITTGLHDQPSDIASVRYQAYLTAGVERWREYRDQLAPLSKKPVLFIMLNSTREADDVANYLATKYPEYFGANDAGDAQLLVIHTDNAGEVSKKDLDAARDVARRVDETASPVNAIVSVLMLREGWDVQNVTVIVGLRPFTSKANILPEQAVGRGLRKMFSGLSTDYVERVDILGNPGFLRFIEQLEKDEDLALDTFDPDQKVEIVKVFPDPDKAARDILIPELSPILARKRTLAEEIEAVDVMAFKVRPLPKKEEDQDPQKFNYEGTDIVTFEKLIEREYSIPIPQTAEEVISYYAKRIASDVKLPSQFAAIAPKVREFLEHKAFGETVDLSSKVIVKAISTRIAAYLTVKTLADALRGLVIDELTPTLVHPGRPLSETPPFPFSRPTFQADKTIFNLVAADNEFERTFAGMLNDAKDVASFAKLPEQFGFAIEYTDSATNLRYYEPDFVAVDTDGNYYLFETKGREDIDVAFKDRAAVSWCENATLLTNQPWQYVKVPQVGFEKLEPAELSELVVAFG